MKSTEPLDSTANFPEDFELEEATLAEVVQGGDVEIVEDEDENFTDFWLPPGKSLRF